MLVLQYQHHRLFRRPELFQGFDIDQREHSVVLHFEGLRSMRFAFPDADEMHQWLERHPIDEWLAQSELGVTLGEVAGDTADGSPEEHQVAWDDEWSRVDTDSLEPLDDDHTQVGRPVPTDGGNRLRRRYTVVCVRANAGDVESALADLAARRVIEDWAEV